MKIEFNSDKGQLNVLRHRKSTILKYPCTTKDDCSPYKVTFPRGTYRIELWGASAAAKGGYTKGEIYFSKEKTFYIHIGSSNGLYNTAPPFAVTANGNKGAGATDIRYSPNVYYDFDSLKTRIMVAAGSGNLEWYAGTGMNAGGLIGEDGISSRRIASGANQTSGGTISEIYRVHGTFGLAGYLNQTSNWGVFGGGGYYGGTSINVDGVAGGGSSFISGYLGCDAIFENSTEDNIFHSHQPIHYSGLEFFHTVMKGGKEEMPDPTGEPTIGHEGDGVARITPLFTLLNFRTCKCRRNQLPFVSFIISLIYSR